MSSINHEGIVEEIMRNNGEYHGDPPVVDLWMYENQFNGAYAYKLVYSPGYDFLGEAAYQGEPRPLMLGGEVTEFGKAWLKQRESRS